MLSFVIGCVGMLFSVEFTPTTPLHPGDTLRRPAKNQVLLADTAIRKVKINRILIIGNRITREHIILRELSVSPGDSVYAHLLESILDLDKKKIYNTRLFNSVDIRVLELEPTVIDLLIDLNERWYTFPVPIFELSDRNFNEWWETYNHDFSRINYGLRLFQYNMRGRNETLRATAQFGFTRKFELSYRFPYIDKKQKQGMGFSLDYSESKNVAYKTEDHKLVFLDSAKILKYTSGASVWYTYRNSFYVQHTISLDYRDNHVKDTIALLNPEYMGSGRTQQRFVSFGYQFVNDHRDVAAYPLNGYYIQASLKKYGLGFTDDLDKFEMMGSFSKYIELPKNFYVANYTNISISTPKNLAYNYYSALGYRKNFVRGYEIYVIEGPNSFLNKTTLKKKIFGKNIELKSMPIEQFRHIPFAVYLKTYADFGYVPNYPNYKVNSRLAGKLLTGAGFGLDVIGSYDVVLRFEYSFNNTGENGFFFHLYKEF